MEVENKNKSINLVKSVLAFLGLGAAFFVFTVMTSAQQQPSFANINALVVPTATVTISSPVDGTVLSGTVEFDAKTDPAVTKVSFKIVNRATQALTAHDGAFDATKNIWTLPFNTSEVADGDYSIGAESSSPAGQAATVAVTIKNQAATVNANVPLNAPSTNAPPASTTPPPPAAPTVGIVKPQASETIAAIYDLLGQASAPASSFYFNVADAAGKLTRFDAQQDAVGGWHASWDTTKSPDGQYQLQAFATINQIVYNSDQRIIGVKNVASVPLININLNINAPVPPPVPIATKITMTGPVNGATLHDIIKLAAKTDAAVNSVTMVLDQMPDGTAAAFQFTAVPDATSTEWFFAWDSRQFPNASYTAYATAAAGQTQLKSDPIKFTVQNATQVPLTFGNANQPPVNAPTLVNTNVNVPVQPPIPIQEVVPDECKKLGITDILECRKVITTIADQNRAEPPADQQVKIRQEVGSIKGRTVVLAPAPVTPQPAAPKSPVAGFPSGNERPPLVGFQTSEKGTVLVNPQELAPEAIENLAPIRPKEPVPLILLPSVEKAQMVSNTEVYTPPIVVAIDSDKDGLPDDVERRLGTNPYDPDTDHDGYSDYEEVKSGHNPLGPGDLKIKLSPIDLAIINRVPLEQPKFAGTPAPKELQVNTVSNVSLPTPGNVAAKKGLQFKGRAAPNSTVTLFIYSSVAMVLTVNTDANGDFQYTLDQPLVDGVHQAYVTVTDQTGRIEKKSNPLSFFVKTAQAASEEDFFRPDVNVQQPAESALNYYIIAAVVLIVAASLFVLRVYWKKIRELSNGS